MRAKLTGGRMRKRETDRQAYRHTAKRERGTVRQTDRQTDKQTDIQTEGELLMIITISVSSVIRDFDYYQERELSL